MATKTKQMKPNTHFADTVISQGDNGYGIGFSICGFYNFWLVVDPKLVTCKNCLKMLATRN
jgi:hypothetical protein